MAHPRTVTSETVFAALEAAGDWLDTLVAAAPQPDAAVPDIPAEYIQGIHRGLRALEEVGVTIPLEWISVEQARAHITKAAYQFIQDGEPGELLLVRVRPGVGKTRMAVRLAEQLAQSGKRVLYCGPRHIFFGDVQAEAEHGDWWYEWQPRDHQNAAGEHDMCRYPDAMATWLNRGYQAKDFCSGVCGWDYMSNDCPYHQQKHRVAQPIHFVDRDEVSRKAKRIVFGQHAHLWTGLPGERFDVVICDENPMTAFLHKWKIPARWVQPDGMDPYEPLTELIHDLAKLAAGSQVYEGEALLRALGGAVHVREVLETWDVEAQAMLLAPRVRYPHEAEQANYGHLFSLVPLLLREARLSEAGTPGNARVVVAHGDLFLLMRHPLSAKFDGVPMIWLDGTADPRISEALSGRAVQVVEPMVEMTGRVFQIWDRANGKATLFKDGGSTPQAEQLALQVEHIIRSGGYTNPGVITFKDIEPGYARYKSGHFSGERGSNEFIGCDCLIVAGSPLPRLVDIVAMAKMIFFERDEPFNTAWMTQDVAYPGQPFAYPVGGFWGDTDLQSVLGQLRESEIEQAAHRGRPITRPCDVWLLTNIPIAGLPPTKLMRLAEMFQAPENVDPYLWLRFIELVELCKSSGESPVLTTNDVVVSLKVSRPTAVKFLDILEERTKDEPEGRKWVSVKAVQVGPGRRMKALAPQRGAA